ncbi:hypothetical protein GUJ93_ZPchr0012g20136 [Zizania palustris]|uniref:Uncharacterized protein n=1 Tax=Zizania palustris TaxID=103762 RepID=A0A8J5WL07_ZIZPA|nr:hypothetical protein GUJ93_ZPchr0012g20136 [Zizania palustris]
MVLSERWLGTEKNMYFLKKGKPIFVSCKSQEGEGVKEEGDNALRNWTGSGAVIVVGQDCEMLPSCTLNESTSSTPFMDGRNDTTSLEDVGTPSLRFPAMQGYPANSRTNR